MFLLIHLDVNAAHEVLDAHSAWQLETLLYFLEVFTVPIFPEREISAIGVKFISAAAEGKANMIAVKLKSFVNLFIFFPVFFYNVSTAYIFKCTIIHITEYAVNINE